MDNEGEEQIKSERSGNLIFEKCVELHGEIDRRMMKYESDVV